jgi:hypothetical protein
MPGGAAASSVMDRAPGVVGNLFGSSITAGDYLHTRAWLDGDRFAVAEGGSNVYAAEEQFWNDAFASRSLFETKRILLEDFVLMDWIPRSPGRYHSDEGRSARSRADSHVLGATTISDRHGNDVLFDPVGKSAMIAGGLGCLRLAMKTIGGAEFKLLSASSTGMAHAGIVVAVSASDYASIGGAIAGGGGLRCSLDAELRYWEPDKYLPVGATVGIPRVYLLVRDIAPASKALPRLDATPAIVFKTSSAEFPGNFFAYTHIDPADGAALDGCVEWMKANYVEARYEGRVLTDFDETTPRFSTTACPLRDVLDPTRPLMDVVAPLVDESLVNPHLAKFYIESLNIERWESTSMSNVTITGDGNVVGNNNQVVTTIHRGLDREGLRELGEASALLRGEILQLDSVPEKTKNQAARALEDAEEEAADENPDEAVVVNSLQRARDVLEAAGETYDSSKAWGQRFLELGKAVAVVLPAAAQYLPRLFG